MEGEQVQAWESFPVAAEKKLESSTNKPGQQAAGTNQIESWNKFANKSGNQIDNSSKGEQVAAWDQFGDKTNVQSIASRSMANSQGSRLKPDADALSGCEKLILFLQRYIMSTMPYTQRWVKEQNIVIQTIDAILRGIAQVNFMNNSITGIFFLIGMFVSSRYYALCMLLGVSVSTITSLVFSLNKSAFSNGIYGYNGTLVGIGIATFHFGNDSAWLLMPQVIGPIVFMSMLSTIFVAGIGSLFVGKFGLSPFTIPFILCVWIWLLGSSGSFTYFPVNGGILEPGLNVNPTVYQVPKQVEYYGPTVIEAVFRGISQVFFQSSTACGVIMLVGMCICSPISAGFALIGAIVSTLTALGLGASTASVYAGLWGYSAVLSSIAIGGMFFVMNSFTCFIYAVLAAVFSAIIHGGVASFMAPFGLPALTFPFNVVAWIWCLAGNSMAGLFPVEITAITIPEDHINRVRLVQMMTSKFKELQQLTTFLDVNRPEDLTILERSLTPVLLCWYASIGDVKSLKELIELGVDLNLQDYDKRSALHLAVAENQNKVLDLLIFHNVELKHDLRGATAFQFHIQKISNSKYNVYIYAKTNKNLQNTIYKSKSKVISGNLLSKQ